MMYHDLPTKTWPFPMAMLDDQICTLKIGRVACTQHGVGSKQTAIASHGSASIHGTKNAHVQMHATAKTWLL